MGETGREMKDARLTGGDSSSPLNGQAAELWETDQAEFKRLVLARHKELEDDEED